MGAIGLILLGIIGILLIYKYGGPRDLGGRDDIDVDGFDDRLDDDIDEDQWLA